MPDDVTLWIDGLRDGDAAAQQKLWEAHFHRLVGVARGRLAGRPTGPAGSEDVALSVFDSLFHGMKAGRFPQLADRTDLWQVLVMLTTRKALTAVRRERAAKRGGGAVAADTSAVEAAPGPEHGDDLPDTCREMLETLPDDDLRRIALWKLEGHTNAEIAEKSDRSVATVERKLALIRKTWESRIED